MVLKMRKLTNKLIAQNADTMKNIVKKSVIKNENTAKIIAPAITPTFCPILAKETKSAKYVLFRLG